MIIQELIEKQLIAPPKFLANNVHYLTIMGSLAYGVAADTSDYDVYGFCIPPKETIFPHLAGVIPSFGRQIQPFEQWQKHHIIDPSARGGKGLEYDFSIYGIIKYFQLCMDCNPNMIDSLYTPQRCVLHATAVGNKVRDNRELFLHKGAWFKFKGYAYSQMHKMKSQERTGKRKALVEEYGYDIKFAYHCIRLLDEVEQIMTEGTMNLERNREQLKSIRRGEWTLEQIEKHFEEKERELEALYTRCDLPPAPDEDRIKKLLLECLELHYGTLGPNAVTKPGEAEQKLQQIKDILGVC